MKKVRKLLVLLLSLLMILSGVVQPASVHAASSASSGKGITLNYSEYTLKKGKKLKLKATAGKGKKVVFTSKNPKVASVDGKGNVKALKKGKTTITAKIKGTKKSATCKITVGTPAKSVTLSQQQVSLTAGDTYRISASVAPAKTSNKKVTYTSTNNNVVKVDKNGIATAINQGVASIKVAAADGSKKSATLTVNVSGKVMKATSIKVSPASTSLVVGTTTKFTATVSPASASQTVAWTSSNSSVASVNSAGEVKAIKAGTATITAKAADGTNVKGTAKVTVVKNIVYANAISLSATDTNLVAGSENNKTYLYATLDGGADKIELYDSNSGLVGQMYDDGQYSSHGDDMMGDMIFSSLQTFGEKDTASRKYYAVAYCGSKKLTSETVSVNVIAGMNQSDRAAMDAADKELEAKIKNIDLKASDSVKKSAAEEVLNDLVKNNTIKAIGSFNSSSQIYSFEYTDGTKGGLYLKEMAASESASATNGATRREEEPGIIDSLFGNPSYSSEVSENALADEPVSNNYVGKAIIYNGFKYTGDSWRDSFYSSTVTDWTKHGLNTVQEDASIADFKSMGNYDVVIFSMHGCFDDADGKAYLCTHEKATSKLDNNYYSYLQNSSVERIVTSEGVFYWPNASFFKDNFSTTALSNTFIFSESCEFMGHNGTVDSTFADTLVSRGANTVVGFHNSVSAYYSRDFMKSFVDNLIVAKTSGEAFDASKKSLGENDGHGAYPILKGSDTAILVSDDLLNGSFELMPALTKWYYSGDARVINSLAELTPKHGSKMAIITTGIGSKQSVYSGGTEGSILSQSFVIPSNVTTLSFDYNVISEEPTEWVNSKYDDKFFATLFDDEGNTIAELAREEVNKSTWYKIEDIDFDGGDKTVYHTKWKAVSYNVSAYAGKKVTLKFVTTDVGDSKWDTASIIDNITLK